MKKQITLTIDESLLRQIRAGARKRHISISAYIIMIVTGQIKAVLIDL